MGEPGLLTTPSHFQSEENYIKSGKRANMARPPAKSLSYSTISVGLLQQPKLKSHAVSRSS
ncbi:hypothetical protein KSP39_PZI022890 [Platanthera zijinensis]|uniref:Uncharacterized protein n=1 Tax=Platanthera zijinensis TaxID=2320716 RepID=A0AAP0AV66_9ASPA